MRERPPHRMLLGTGCYQVGKNGCLPHRMLLGTGRYQVGSDGCSPLLGTGPYQVGSDGCSPHRMLLGTGRCQVGSDGCSSHRMLLGIQCHSGFQLFENTPCAFGPTQGRSGELRPVSCFCTVTGGPGPKQIVSHNGHSGAILGLM